MIKGYVILVDGKEIIKVGYSQNNTDYSHLGLQVLDAMKTYNGIVSLIEEMNEADLEWEENVCCYVRTWHRNLEQFDSSWYKKTKETKPYTFFVAYAYECDVKRGILTVYYYGNKVLTVDRDSFPLIKYVFANYEKFWKAFGFDTETLEFNNDDADREIRRMVKYRKTVAEAETIINRRLNNIGFHISTEFKEDYWENAYRKTVQYKDTNIKFDIVFSRQRYGKQEYTLYICTPLGRIPFTEGSHKTEMGAARALQNFVSENSLGLLECHKVMTIWAECTATIKGKYASFMEENNITSDTLKSLENFLQEQVDLFNHRFNTEVNHEIRAMFSPYLSKKEYIQEEFRVKTFRLLNKLKAKLIG